MIPPITPNGVDVSAHLSKWTPYQDYDSLHSCVVAWSELKNRAAQNSNVTPPLEFPHRQLEQFAAAQCVASDDPDLKSK